MAKLLKDNADDLPDLGVEVSKYGGRSSPSKPNSGRHTFENLGQEERALKCKKSTEASEKRVSGFLKCGKKIEQVSAGSKTQKPRKRVLNHLHDHQPLPTLKFEARDQASPKSSDDVQSKRSARLNPPVRPQAVDGMTETTTSEEEESAFADDSTGLSDFVVNDSSSIQEESSDEELDLRPSRTFRRLVKGRKRSLRASVSEIGKAKSMETSELKTRQTTPSPTGRIQKAINRAYVNPTYSTDSDQDPPHNPTSPNIRDTTRQPSEDQASYLDLGEPFTRLKISTLEDTFMQAAPESPSATPRPSPRKRQVRLLSPKKPSQIPSTPHRPSMDAFWSQDIINEWNDDFSPTKVPFVIDENNSCNKVPSILKNTKPESSINRTALVKKDFEKKKHEIAETFLRELDETVTDCKISKMATSTGGVKIHWSKKLNTTAGRANWKRETINGQIVGADGQLTSNITYCHHASIELAEKVIDDEDRLLNVIAHEFCHLANFMVSDIRNNPHGKEFKAWATKCSQHFGNRGIYVTTKHSYTIDYKYIWECTSCGTEFKRHSKSIDPTKHQCRSCKSKLVQIKPAPKSNIASSEYQIFLRDNMKKVKEENPGSPQKEIMGMVGKMYQVYKKSKLGHLKEHLDEVNVNTKETLEEKDRTLAKNLVDTAVKKLDFIDLTSP